MNPINKKIVSIFSILAIQFLLNASATFSRNTAFEGYSEGPFKPNQQNPVTRSEVLVFSTRYGDIRVFLRQDAAPKTVEYMKSLAREGLFDGCGFYRVEPSGETVDHDRKGTRRGYALVQGGLYSCGRQQSIVLPTEPVLHNNGTSEFFFNLEDHHEWDKSFNVWGTIFDEASLAVLQKIVALPTYQEDHPSGTVMRILKTPVEYRAKALWRWRLVYLAEVETTMRRWLTGSRANLEIIFTPFR
ncbi:peptidyl-prolyl cis-trans isomerase ppi1 isoform X2 [Cryptomeria japonica]|uniref:peptidyl-prolyl cis-trans isomerase ppi1 isoform X2 n=1 Tax=Cryptomeria japonica TaxID=3369 RepID=UPI0027D9DE5D|nr:peptidyl-prolyl cis-trans isomerase ppi1 isoform X2 [Cryptomeria japonica]